MPLPVIDASEYRHWVDLEDPVEDGTPTVFNPARVKCSIEPVAPGTFDENRITHVVKMRFHSQVMFNTQMLFVDRHNQTHRLIVKGYQNVGMASRELALLCEEVMTP